MHRAAFLPERDGNRLTRIDRGGEAAGVAADRGRVPVREGLEQGAAGDAVGAHAVQDRCGEPGPGGEFRVRMQRVAVSRQTIKQGLSGARRDFHDAIGGAVGHCGRFRLAGGRAAEIPVAAREGRALEGVERVALRIPHFGLAHQDRALVALVPCAEPAAVRGDLGGDGQGFVEGDVALRVDHHHPVDVDGRGAGVPCRDRGEGRHDLHRGLAPGVPAFVDEGELLRAGGVLSHADAKGVEHDVAVVPAGRNGFAAQLRQVCGYGHVASCPGRRLLCGAVRPGILRQGNVSIKGRRWVCAERRAAAVG